MTSEEIKARVKAIISRNYKMASGQWAGGETDITVKFGESEASGESYTAWSRNRKWSGKSARLFVTVSPDWDNLPQHLKVCGGMLTTEATQTAPDCWAAKWVVQGRGFSINIESGFIVAATIDGKISHAHATTERAARNQISRRLSEPVAASHAARIKNLSIAQLFATYGNTPIQFGDSIKGGNCISGTRSWIEVNFPGRKVGQIKEILEKGIKIDAYVEAAIRAAIVRYLVSGGNKKAKNTN